MSKRRISDSRKDSSARASRAGSRSVGVKKQSVRPLKKSVHKVSFKVCRYMGISLSGGKNDKTWIALIEHYPRQKKIFLTHLFDKLKSDGEISSDTILLDIVTQHKDGLQSISLDAPLTLPICFSCRPHCDGFENCHEPHVDWMRRAYRKMKRSKPNTRLFTPYTQRCVETVIAEAMEDGVLPQPALGANLAPLTARAQYLARRLDFPLLEVYPALSMKRMGDQLGLTPRQIQFYRHSMHGSQSRHEFVRRLIEKELLFVYQQDVSKLVDYPQAFDALLIALSGFLNGQEQTEPRPKGFPRKEGWVEFPRKDFKWF